MSDDEPIEGYTPGEVAALLILLMRNLSGGLAAHGSFADQLTASANLGQGNADLDNSIKAITAFYRVRPDLVDAAHFAIRDLLITLRDTEFENGLRWSSCKFITQEQILRISRL